MKVKLLDGFKKKEVAACRYIGIDPGANGGLACVLEDEVEAVKMPATEKDIWTWFISRTRPAFSDLNVYAVIEQIIPRPTSYFDKSSGSWRASILKSTCLLYASYVQLRAMLVAAGIPFEVVTPQRWQKALGIRSKEKGETPTSWKNELKAKAQQLFPQEKITLATADSLLLLEYCRRLREGTLR